MAKISNTILTRIEKPKRKRKGIHSKCKSSALKTSKHYQKAYRGQGK